MLVQHFLSPFFHFFSIDCNFSFVHNRWRNHFFCFLSFVIFELVSLMRARQNMQHCVANMGIVLQTWALHRLSALPAHAIIVFERAEGRVRIWREKNAEPPIVLRIIVHVDAVPTAISSGSDAYWLPALQRWASPSEVARLFGLKAKHSAARALQSRFVSDRVPFDVNGVSSAIERALLHPPVQWSVRAGD